MKEKGKLEDRSEVCEGGSRQKREERGERRREDEDVRREGEKLLGCVRGWWVEG